MRCKCNSATPFYSKLTCVQEHIFQTTEKQRFSRESNQKNREYMMKEPFYRSTKSCVRSSELAGAARSVAPCSSTKLQKRMEFRSWLFASVSARHMTRSAQVSKNSRTTAWRSAAAHPPDGVERGSGLPRRVRREPLGLRHPLHPGSGRGLGRPPVDHVDDLQHCGLPRWPPWRSAASASPHRRGGWPRRGAPPTPATARPRRPPAAGRRGARGRGALGEDVPGRVVERDEPRDLAAGTLGCWSRLPL